jgi:carbon-monoxide dehydrogenase large subunit
MTNTVPIDAYRGAGRPEAAYLIERLVEKAARQLGMDSVDLRRRNFIRPEQFPYKTATGRSYDSGDYARIMDSALSRAGWKDFEQRRKKSDESGKLRGIGLAYYVEICSAMGDEHAYIGFGRDGRLLVRSGTQSTGQGHETSYAQMVAGGLGIDIDRIDVIEGDTDRVPTGNGTVGSRSMVIGGSAIYRTVESLIEAGRSMAGQVLEVAEGDIEFDSGDYRVAGTDRKVSLVEVGASVFRRCAQAGRGRARTREQQRLRARRRNFSERLPCLRGGGRSPNRRHRDPALYHRR